MIAPGRDEASRQTVGVRLPLRRDPLMGVVVKSDSMVLEGRARLFLRRQSRSALTPAGECIRRCYGRWTWIIRPCAVGPSLDRILKDPDGTLAARADLIKMNDSIAVAHVSWYVIKRWTSRGVG